MTQSHSSFIIATLRARRRVPQAIWLLVILSVVGFGIGVTARVDRPSNVPTVAKAAAAAAIVPDPSVPEASRALSGRDWQMETPTATF